MKIFTLGLSGILLLSSSFGTAHENSEVQVEAEETATTDELPETDADPRSEDNEVYHPDHHDHYKFRVIEAGPIWNNKDAHRKCPHICSAHGASWTGEWWTTVYNKMSVCECVFH